MTAPDIPAEAVDMVAMMILDAEDNSGFGNGHRWHVSHERVRDVARTRARTAIAAAAALVGEPIPTTGQEARDLFNRALRQYFPRPTKAAVSVKGKRK